MSSIPTLALPSAAFEWLRVVDSNADLCEVVQFDLGTCIDVNLRRLDVSFPRAPLYEFVSSANTEHRTYVGELRARFRLRKADRFTVSQSWFASSA